MELAIPQTVVLPGAGTGNPLRETVPSQTSDMGGKTLSVLAHSFLLP